MQLEERYMKKNNPMFDIEDSEEIDLTRNETSSEKLLKAKNVKKLKAKDNKAGISNNSKARQFWHETSWGKIIIGCIIGIIVLAISYYFSNSSV